MTLPTLFVPHGATTSALQPGAAGAALVPLVKRFVASFDDLVIALEGYRSDPVTRAVQ